MLLKTLQTASAIVLLCSLLPAQVHEGAASCSSGVGPLAYGEHAACSLSSPSEIDVYRFSGKSGDRVRVSVSGTGTSCLDCRFEVIDSMGMLIFSNACNTDCFTTNRCSVAAESVLPSSGMFTILVSDAGQNNSGTYVLNLERLQPEIPDSFLEYGIPRSVSIGHFSDHDFLSLRGSAGDLIRITVAGTSTTCMAGAYRLYEPNGNLLDSGSCSTDCFTTNQCTAISPNILLPEDGDYALMIQDAGLNNTGTVSVTVTCIVGTCLPNWVPVGANYCATNPNSTGNPAATKAWGSETLGDETLYLYASSAPRNVSGIFFMGPNQVVAPLGEGVRCVGGMVLRFPVVNAGNRGELRRKVDFAALPQGVQFQPGETWNFQGWFRDGQESNTSDALQITFQ